MSRFDNSDLPREPGPAANFLAQPAPWVKHAQCRGLTDLFFAEDEPSVAAAQSVCAACPVRKECGAEVMAMEGTADETGRYGFRAYMTPQQRVSIQRRGGLLERDPKDLVEGNDGGRSVPPVPVDGDRWSRRHTDLARQVVARLNETLVRGEVLPDTEYLAKLLGCNATPLRRVLEGLVQDGTLDLVRDQFVMRGGARAIDWLPLHLRHDN